MIFNRLTNLFVVYLFQVGGGLSVGYSILETAFKEAEEEASITKELMTNMKSAGSVS